jgi:hypothetical protein
MKINRTRLVVRALLTSAILAAASSSTLLAATFKIVGTG